MILMINNLTMQHFRTILTLSLIAIISSVMCAETLNINKFDYAGPFVVDRFVMLEGGENLESVTNPLNFPVNLDALSMCQIDLAKEEIKSADGKALNILVSKFENRQFLEPELNVEGLDQFQMFLDGEEIKNGKIKLHPGTHRLTIKFVTENDVMQVPSVSLTNLKQNSIHFVDDGSRMLSLDDILYGTRIDGARVSPKGNYILVDYSELLDGDNTKKYQRLYDVKGGKFVATLAEGHKWMPRTEKYYKINNSYQGKRAIVTINPQDGEEKILANNIPEGDFVISPTEDYLVFTKIREGKKEDPEIYQILETTDRQPGWRDRKYPAIYPLKGPALLQPLAVGEENIELLDISDDGSKLLLMTNRLRMTARPTTLFSIMILDLNSMTLDTVVEDDGFINSAYFTPDAKQIVVKGSPEAFDRIGCTLPADVLPSMYDNQLYLLNISDKTVRPLTRNFNPAVNQSVWNRYDNQIYLTATDKDQFTLYKLNPITGDIVQIDALENVVKGVSISDSPMIAWWGQSDSNPDGVYSHNLNSHQTKLLDRPSEQRLSDVKIGQCIDWKFQNQKGEEVTARYYLPDNFDANKKYPLIVNYYGGCTPSTRNFESRYPHHLYSALGYVTLVIQPSGATGFGQEWSSRHVSTAGKGVAEDIISGTKQFCDEMPYIDSQRIGCIGASYGGFMTQYLQTQTDMFKAAISHAGISDHTSYWGEGYWGYSYSEVSMGEDLPWTNPDLYVKQSPLYNADKINTPILFLHGDGDTNVPPGESIQIYTALKRLGKDTALVLVKDQNHHILNPSQRKKWQDTIFAWFAKYLQDDPTWWNSLYGE